MTKGLFVGLLAGLLGAAIFAGPVRAAEEKPKAFIVLVGIDSYADKQIKARKHAEADVKALYDLFTNPKYLGVDKDHIKLLLGGKDDKHPSEAATHENIIKELHWAVSHAGKDDLLIFAFMGQGAPVGDRVCFLGTDSTFKDRSKNAVTGAEIEHELSKLKSQHFCALIDVSFKGIDVGKEVVAEPKPEDLYKIFLGDSDKEDPTPPPGRVVFLATNGLSQSLDLEKHGLFTKALLDGLHGKADKEGYEPDGIVTVDELVEFLNQEVPRLAREHGQTKAEKEQLYHVLGGRTSHFPLTNNPDAYPKAQERLTKLAKLAEDQKITPEIAEEGQKLLSRMPKLKTMQELRKDYQKLVDGSLPVEDFLKDRTKLYASMKMKKAECLEYAAKVMSAVQMVREGYVKETSPGDLVVWAIQGLLRRVDEKSMLADLKDQLKKAKTMKDAGLTTLLADVREKLGKREDLEKNKDVDISVQEMLRHLDPYTNYISADDLNRIKTEMTGKFYGIGIQIRKDVTRDMLVVVTPIKGSPAYKAGLKQGDVITKVTCYHDKKGNELEKPEVISTKGLPLSDAVSRILGKPGTKVTVTVERQVKGEDDKVETKTLNFDIVRGAVEVESVMGVKRKGDDSWDYMIDPESRICYVRLTSFARNTYRDLHKIVKELSSEKPGIRGFILDLRFNPGGLLDSAVKICDLFIDDGVIVSIRPRVGKEVSYSGEHDGSYLNFPMVCLINGGSASGSEIVAGCLQDHRRAIIMGERSYGKGSVQNIQPFEQTGGEIKLTTATFWRPSGKNINKSSTKGSDDEDWGIIPDKGYVLKLTPKEREELADQQRDTEIIARRDLPVKETKPTEFKDQQLEKALDYLRGQIKTASKAPTKKAG